MRGVEALAALALLGTAAAAQPPPAISAAYLCEGGAVLRVAYINPAQAEGFAIVDWAGRLIPMRQLRAASGVRYVALDEQDGHRWHTKGDEGFLARLAPDHTATEEVVLRGCRRIG